MYIHFRIQIIPLSLINQRQETIATEIIAKVE